MVSAKGCLQVPSGVLAGYTWPGNVRQLMSVVNAGYALADATWIDESDIASQLDGYQFPPGTGNAATPAAEAAPTRSSPPLGTDVLSQGSFWESVHRAFINRDLNRTQVRAFVARGLEATHGSYRRLIELLGLPAHDYQRVMDFLRHHDLKPDQVDDIETREFELGSRAMEP